MRTAALLSLTLLATPALAYEGGPVADGGRIDGVVSFGGKAPAPKMLPITRDQDVCGKAPRASRELMVSPTGGLQHAVVWIEGIARGKATPAKPVVTLNNTGCAFEPHVQGALAGATINVKNSDDVLHNTHARQGSDHLTVFNVGLPVQGQVSRQRLRGPGLITVGCDAGHTWMRSYIYVFDHPYFTVTDAAGKFTLGDVPPGTYKLGIWHETLGTRTVDVTVKPKATATVKATLGK